MFYVPSLRGGSYEKEVDQEAKAKAKDQRGNGIYTASTVSSTYMYVREILK